MTRAASTSAASWLASGRGGSRDRLAPRSGSSTSAAIRCSPCAWWSASARRSGSRCRWGGSSTTLRFAGRRLRIALSGDGGARGLWRNVAPGTTHCAPWAVPGAHARQEQWYVHAAIARTLRRKRPVHVLYPPHSRKQPDVETIASEAVDALRAVQPQGPYDIVGDCLGGVLAFEIARQLTARGCVVGRLVLLDSLYPARRPGSRLVQLARDSTRARRLWLRCLAGSHRLAALKARLEGRGATARREHLDLARHLIPPRYSEKYMLELARYRLRPWDGALDYVVSESLGGRLPQQAWEPHVAAVRVHRAAGEPRHLPLARGWRTTAGSFGSLLE